ncbi:hypothetical protein [Spiroplasma endosymbiont of Nephrotoma flavescens]|uniref:hypothetical protein n=1 Tax=Spiroplasma endosymbiont of Nephrotoma flavescens TaxID=3066302 RepID=UPI00313AAAFA
MDKIFKLINSINIASIFALPIFGCSLSVTDQAVIFANHPLSIYDNATTKNFYNSSIDILDNYWIIDNIADKSTQLLFWQNMLNTHTKNKTKYFIALNHNFANNIPNLTKELEKSVATGNKIITLDYDYVHNSVSNKIVNLVEIKFDVLTMGYNLGYQSGIYMLKNHQDFTMIDNKIQVSAVEYLNDQLAQRLTFGFQQGLYQAQIDSKQDGGYEFNFVDWQTSIDNRDPLIISDWNRNNMYNTAKALLENHQVSLIFDPLLLYSNNLVKAFIDNNDNLKKHYFVSVDIMNKEKYHIKPKNYLLASINRNFTGILSKIYHSEEIKPQLLTDWNFVSDIIVDIQDIKFSHQQFDNNKFVWKPLQCNVINAPLSQHFCKEGTS